MWLLVIGVGLISRHIGVVAEECLVECGNSCGRVAHTLHANRREVDIEIATKAGNRFGILRIKVSIFVSADANETSFVASDDSAVPAERPAEWAHGIGKNLTSVGSGVVGEALTCWPVGYPSISHIRPLTRSKYSD